MSFRGGDQGVWRRLGVCADFGGASKRMGLNWLKSRVERSWSRKSSASASVARHGTDFGEDSRIAGDLFDAVTLVRTDALAILINRQKDPIDSLLFLYEVFFQ